MNWDKTLDPKGITVKYTGSGTPRVSIVQDATATTPRFPLLLRYADDQSCGCTGGDCRGYGVGGFQVTRKPRRGLTLWWPETAQPPSPSRTILHSPTKAQQRRRWPRSRRRTPALYQQVKAALATRNRDSASERGSGRHLCQCGPRSRCLEGPGQCERYVGDRPGGENHE